jgi:sporulation integral membrane protein YlbJ
MRKKQPWAATVLALALAAVTVMLLVFPKEGLSAALRGVSIWWDVLFPALFPFFIISEMLLGFGIVHFFGTLLDPMMRPLFRVPGIGGFAMALGFASGYPVGARLTSQLWEQQLVTREEGERLVAFITTSDPIFLIGAVSVGFFHDASLAGVLAVAHYGTAVLIGLMMRYYGPKAPAAKVNKSNGERRPSIWLRAFHAMHEARVKDGRPIGTLLNQAVGNALQMNFVVGGLVVFFSVVLEVLSAGGVMQVCYRAVNVVLHGVGLPASLSNAVVSGIFEVTLGTKASASAGPELSLVSKAAIAAFVLSWAGLSVHAQIVSLLSSTNLRYAPFLFARFLHGILSAIAVFLLWEPLRPLRGGLAAFASTAGVSTSLLSFWSWALPFGGVVFALAMLGLLGFTVLRAVTK